MLDQKTQTLPANSKRPDLLCQQALFGGANGSMANPAKPSRSQPRPRDVIAHRA